MATRFEIDCALMAGGSYISSRPFDANRFPVPEGWLEATSERRTRPSGFEATYFTKGTDIVISFAGTNPLQLGDWTSANVPLAFGIVSDQVKDAVDYYLQVKAANANANITFTGHSLGGGLASLMAVMFGETARTFDQAPFLNSAKTFTTTDFLSGDTIPRSVALDLRAYLAGKATVNGVIDPQIANLLAPLDAYIAAADPFNPSPNPADTLAARSGQVTNINTQGEFLSSWYLVPSSNRIGSQADMANIDNVSGLDLHSQALLTAMLQSGDTKDSTATDHTLGQVTFKLTDLLKMIFDKNLYAHDTDTDKQNFLERLVQHEAGASTTATTAAITADAMVTRFTSDLWKLAQSGGMTMNDGNSLTFWNNASKTLTAFAMQFYYEDTANATNSNKQLFTDLGTTGAGSNGATFDMHDVSKDVAAAMDANAQVDLTKAKGYQYFQAYLDQTSLLTPEERSLITSLLPYMRDWYIQAGTSALNATDTHNRNAFMLGSSGNDVLIGGAANDYNYDLKRRAA